MGRIYNMSKDQTVLLYRCPVDHAHSGAERKLEQIAAEQGAQTNFDRLIAVEIKRCQRTRSVLNFRAAMGIHIARMEDSTLPEWHPFVQYGIANSHRIVNIPGYNHLYLLRSPGERILLDLGEQDNEYAALKVLKTTKHRTLLGLYLPEDVSALYSGHQQRLEQPAV